MADMTPDNFLGARGSTRVALVRQESQRQRQF